VTLAHAAHGGSVLGWLLPAAVLLPAAAYGRALRVRRAGGRGWPAWRATSGLVGIVVVAIAVSPPVQAAGRTDLRAHMAQHLALGMLAPVALVLSAPVTLLLGALPVTSRRRAAAVLRSRALHVVAHPVSAALLDVGGLYVLHLTTLFQLAHDVPLVHSLVTVHFVLAGYLFSWSIAGPDPAPRRPGTAVRVAVLIAAGAAHGHLAKLLYARAAELPPGVGAAADEAQTAAQLMYYGGGVAELALAIALFGGRPVRRACGACAGPRPRRRPSSSPTCARVASSPQAPPEPRPACRSRPSPPPRSPAGR
jgi:putative membrane protein